MALVRFQSRNTTGRHDKHGCCYGWLFFRSKVANDGKLKVVLLPVLVDTISPTRRENDLPFNADNRKRGARLTAHALALGV
jgi:hypothetical protein